MFPCAAAIGCDGGCWVIPITFVLFGTQHYNTGNTQHVLYDLLPPPSTVLQTYDLRQCAHDRLIPAHTGHLTDTHFITRLIYKDAY